jgi:uncharacterized protein (DUF3084 family)
MDGILMQIDISAVLTVLAGLLIGCSATMIVVWFINKAKTKIFNEDLQRQLDGAKKEAENIIR